MKTIKAIIRPAKYATGLMVIAALAVGCTQNGETKDETIARLQAENEEMKTELLSSYEEISGMMATLNEVDKNIQAIKEKEGMMTVASGEGELSPSTREKMVNDIETINSLLSDSRNQISDLNEKLRSSQISIREYREKITALNADLQQRNAELASMQETVESQDFQIKDLNQTVRALVDEGIAQQNMIDRQMEIMNAQEQALYTAYYTAGSFKDLKNKGVVEKEGGFLWLGQDKKLTDHFDPQYFNSIDIRSTTEIPLYSDKVKLVTDHPADSYEIIEGDDENDFAYLEITDPQEFWKTSKYMVMEYK